MYGNVVQKYLLLEYTSDAKLTDDKKTGTKGWLKVESLIITDQQCVFYRIVKVKYFFSGITLRTMSETTEQEHGLQKDILSLKNEMIFAHYFSFAWFSLKCQTDVEV